MNLVARFLELGKYLLSNVGTIVHVLYARMGIDNPCTNRQHHNNKAHVNKIDLKKTLKKHNTLLQNEESMVLVQRRMNTNY